MAKESIEDKVFRVYSIEDFRKEILKSYPNGFNITIPNESLNRIKLLYENRGNNETFNGLIDSNNNLLVSHGSLCAQIRISPSDYCKIYPHGDSYFNPELSQDGLDYDENLATNFLTLNPEVKQGRIEINEINVENILIEKLPLQQFIQLTEGNPEATEVEIKNLIASRIENKERISDINIFSLKEGGLAIRCKIDGVQQSATKMSKEDANTLSEKTDRTELAYKYFQNEINDNREINKGIKL